MSFLSDLFEGNFNNLGTDISHAPASFSRDWSSEEPYVIGAGALAGGLLLGPAVGALAGAADGAIGGAAAAGAGAAAADGAAGGLAAANDIFGGFDPGLFAANAGDAAGAGAAGTDASTLEALGVTPADGATSTVAAGDGTTTGAPVASDGGAPVAADGAGAPPAQVSPPIPGDGAPIAGGDPLANTSFAPSDGLSAFAPTDGSVSAGPFTDGGGTGLGGGDGAQAGLNAANQDFGAFNPQNFASQSSDVANNPLGADIPGGGTVGQSGVGSPALSGTTSAASTAGKGGGFLSDLMGGSFTGKDALTLGLAAAPIGIALAMGNPTNTAAGQQAQQNASALAAFGNQQLQAGTSGTLNAGQQALITQTQQNLQNQWLQTLYNEGVQDPTKDARWPMIQATIQTQVNAQIAQMLQQDISNGLAALGASSQTLTQLSQQQLQQDQNFTNMLVNATSSAARLLAGTPNTVTLKTS